MFCTYSATVFSRSWILAELFSIVLRFILTLIESIHTLSVDVDGFNIKCVSISSNFLCKYIFSFFLYVEMTNRYCEPRRKLRRNSWRVLWRRSPQFLDPTNNGNCTPPLGREESAKKRWYNNCRTARLRLLDKNRYRESGEKVRTPISIAPVIFEIIYRIYSGWHNLFSSFQVEALVEIADRRRIVIIVPIPNVRRSQWVAATVNDLSLAFLAHLKSNFTFKHRSRSKIDDVSL